MFLRYKGRKADTSCDVDQGPVCGTLQSYELECASWASGPIFHRSKIFSQVIAASRGMPCCNSLACRISKRGLFMTDAPIIAAKSPVEVEVEEGKNYTWCRCGRSGNRTSRSLSTVSWTNLTGETVSAPRPGVCASYRPAFNRSSAQRSRPAGTAAGSISISGFAAKTAPASR